ncbi:MAG: DUF5012 domain-containing protein [Muribaculaceae bacterium]|nr:DUF5012 domain-containing protein [Muribaculaceae bacterium]MDE6610677.1 DUF5012 domain-containing protein [Muribaculaceae bacterium]
MNKYIKLLAGTVVASGLWSCSKDNEPDPEIMYYPSIELEGEQYMYLTEGATFVDPGFTALKDGTEANDEVVVTNNINASKPGLYEVDYAIYNDYGYSANATRYVMVIAQGDKASGIYEVQPDSYRDYNGEVYFGGYQIKVIGNGDGTYYVDDLLGGWYYYRAGYGFNYALQGELTIAADGTVTMDNSWLIGWGDSANDLTDGKFDAATNTLSWVVSYTDYPFLFHVNMIRKDF